MLASVAYWRARLPDAVLHGSLLFLPFVILGLAASRFWLFLLTSILITGLLARSIGLVFGRAGMVSLCQASFAGLGGWIVGWLTFGASVPFELALLLAGIAVTPVGILVGLPALRLRGVNLAVVTLGFAMATSVIVFNRGFPGSGTNFAVPRPGWIADPRSYFFFALTVAALIELGLRWLERRRFGSSWKAVGSSERTTAALGLSVPATKLSAFGVSAFVAGVSGGLMAGQVGVLSGQAFDVTASLVAFALAALAGSQHLVGGILAGVLFVGLPELLRIFDWPQDFARLVFAIGAIQALSQGRGGIAGQWQELVFARRAKSPHVPRVEVEVKAPELPPRDVPTLRLEDLAVTYGTVRAVDNVSMEIEPGVVHGLIGPNGAGKSSLIDAATGYTRAEGRVLLGDQDLSRLRVHKRSRAGLRRTFQRERTVPELTIDAYLRLSAGDQLCADESSWLLDLFALPTGETRIFNVDTGGRRRLEVAAAAAARPAVLLLDEPAAGLTDEESAALATAIATLADHYGMGILLVEHDIQLVRSICPSVSVLDRGSLLGTGTPEGLLSRADVVEAYLGELTQDPRS